MSTRMRQGSDCYVGDWASNRQEERGAFERFVDFVTERLKVYPDLHIYHFAPYEPAAMKRLMGRYATRENEVDSLVARGDFRRPLFRRAPWYSSERRELFDKEARAALFVRPNRAVGRRRRGDGPYPGTS